VVAGLAYEIIKWSARWYERSALVRLALAPGLALQRLTTREPDAAMLEVSIAALQRVLASEGLLTPAEDDQAKGANESNGHSA